MTVHALFQINMFSISGTNYSELILIAEVEPSQFIQNNMEINVNFLLLCSVTVCLIQV